MRMMNWAALSIAAGMSSCSLMATTNLPEAPTAAPQASATIVAREAAAPVVAVLARSAPRPA